MLNLFTLRPATDTFEIIICELSYDMHIFKNTHRKVKK
jgi:hypothetical protein